MFGQFLNSLPTRVNNSIGNFINKAKRGVSNIFRGRITNPSQLFGSAGQSVPQITEPQRRGGIFNAQPSTGSTPQIVTDKGNFADFPFGRSTVNGPEFFTQFANSSDPGIQQSFRDVASDVDRRAVTNQSSRQPSGLSQNTQRFDPQTGQMVPADQSVGGATGFTPETSFSFSASGFNPITGQSGAMGVAGGGGSNFTGLLGAAGGLGTPSTLIGGDTEDTRSGDARTIRERNIEFLQQNPLGSINPAGDFVPAQVQTPEIESQVDAGEIAPTEDTSRSVSTRLSNGVDDGAQMAAEISKIYNDSINRQTIAGASAIDTAPPISPELEAFLDEQPFDAASMMQDVVAQSGLSQFQGQKIEAMKALQGVTDAYTKIADDIKQNPDLPKGLAQRRLKAVYETQKNVVSQLLGQIEVLDTQIAQTNSSLKRQFGIIETRAEQENEMRENARQRISDNLSLLLETGAIGGMSDFEIEQWAELAGIAPKILKKARDTALQPERNIITKEDAQGNLVGVDKNTGKTIWKAPGFGTPQSGDGTGAVRFSTETVNGQRVEFGFDPQGNVVSQTTLGQAGTKSLAEKENLVKSFIQTKLQPLKNALTSDQVNTIVTDMASRLGIAVSEEIEDEANEVRTKGFVNKLLGQGDEIPEDIQTLLNQN